MTTDLTETLDAIQERVSAATKGPWEQASNGWVYPPAGVSEGHVCETQNPLRREEDATFIAHSRTDVEWMARALQKVVERACFEIADAQAGQRMHAEMDNGPGIFAEGAREQAWRKALRIIEGAFQSGGES